MPSKRKRSGGAGGGKAATKRPATKRPAPKRSAATKRPATKRPAPKRSPIGARGYAAVSPTTTVDRSTRERLKSALEDMVSILGARGVSIRSIDKASIWTLAARFKLPSPYSYADLGGALSDLARSSRIERRVGRDRLSRMRVVYFDSNGLVTPYTLSEISPWTLMVARALDRVTVSDGRLGDSLTARYATDGAKRSWLDSIEIWLSYNVANRKG